MSLGYSAEFYQQLARIGYAEHIEQLKETISVCLSSEGHGDFDKWSRALAQLPDVTPSLLKLDTAQVQIGQPSDLSQAQHEQLLQQLKRFHPWRKGPFNVFGHHIDTEWRSDWKWERLQNEISNLTGRKVLDIGCGSGYHCWRMRGAGADWVLGIDPTLVFVMQFFVMQRYINDAAVNVLPLALAELGNACAAFDSVFSMGLLYHQRDPHTHLHELKNCLRDDGELILETLVIDSSFGEVLEPQGRYAQMRNVWSIPSVSTLQKWLKQAGFRHIRCINVCTTSSEEQRVTEWMQFQSLRDFLDPDDQSKTIEGYPAPMRAIMLANK